MANILDDESGNPSMSKLLLMGSFIVASLIMVLQALKPAGVSSDLLIAFLGPFTTAYVGKAVSNAISSKS